MNIFIETYHMVNNIIHLPKKIIDARKEAKIKQELLLEKEERQKKLLQETANTISSTSNVDKLLEDTGIMEEFSTQLVMDNNSNKESRALNLSRAKRV